jgi:hypothetical protein
MREKDWQDIRDGSISLSVILGGKPNFKITQLIEPLGPVIEGFVVQNNPYSIFTKKLDQPLNNINRGRFRSKSSYFQVLNSRTFLSIFQNNIYAFSIKTPCINPIPGKILVQIIFSKNCVHH